MCRLTESNSNMMLEQKYAPVTRAAFFENSGDLYNSLMIICNIPLILNIRFLYVWDESKFWWIHLWYLKFLTKQEFFLVICELRPNSIETFFALWQMDENVKFNIKCTPITQWKCHVLCTFSTQVKTNLTPTTLSLPIVA